MVYCVAFVCNANSCKNRVTRSSSKSPTQPAKEMSRTVCFARLNSR